MYRYWSKNVQKIHSIKISLKKYRFLDGHRITFFVMKPTSNHFLNKVSREEK